MRTEVIFVSNEPKRIDEIQLVEIYRRRISRRKRVAKRLMKKIPLFAWQEMQDEFRGYTLEQWIEDVTRKTRKSNSIRHVKTFRFDWALIRSEAAEFFYKCVVRKPTVAVVRMRKDDATYRITIRSKYYDEKGQSRLDTVKLLALLRGNLKGLLTHPAVRIEKEIDDLGL